MKVFRLLSASLALAVLCCCWGSQTSRNANANGLTGDARDRQLLLTATGDYLKAKYGPDFLGMRRRMLERAKALFEEVLNDGAASPKSKREAADMLSKVSEKLAQSSH